MNRGRTRYVFRSAVLAAVFAAFVAVLCLGGGSALADSGAVWAWGDDLGGQLGDGRSGFDQFSSIARRIAGPTDMVAVTGGLYHSLALASDGTVWAWGSNAAGQLGDSTFVDNALPVHVVGPGGTGAAKRARTSGRLLEKRL